MLMRLKLFLAGFVLVLFQNVRRALISRRKDDTFTGSPYRVIFSARPHSFVNATSNTDTAISSSCPSVRLSVRA